jgi:hypothetical protein
MPLAPPYVAFESLAWVCAGPAMHQIEYAQERCESRDQRHTSQDLWRSELFPNRSSRLRFRARLEYPRQSFNRPAATVFSSASFVKGYFDAMGLIPPAQKFNVSNEILGIAMESFSAGRAETKIRHVEVPVAALDIGSYSAQ